MKGYILMSRAQQHVDETWAYLAGESIEAALRVVTEIGKALEKLVVNPGLGHYREDLADKRHKFYLVYSYLIVYRPSTNPLQIVGIFHASRDIRALLELPE